MFRVRWRGYCLLHADHVGRACIARKGAAYVANGESVCDLYVAAMVIVWAREPVGLEGLMQVSPVAILFVAILL
jgi:hypothetical protein